MNEERYQEARRTPGMRKAFLRECHTQLILPSEYGQFVSRVSHRRILVSSYGMEGLMAIMPGLFSWFGIKHQKSQILVADLAFAELSNLADFSSVLVYHEGKHAEQFYHNPRTILEYRVEYGKLSSEMLEREIEANLNQLDNLTPENSRDFVRMIYERLSSLRR